MKNQMGKERENQSVYSTVGFLSDRSCGCLQSKHFEATTPRSEQKKRSRSRIDILPSGLGLWGLGL